VAAKHSLAFVAVAVARVAQVGGVIPWRQRGGDKGGGAVDAGLEVLGDGLPGGAVGAGNAKAGGSLGQHSGDGGATGLAQLWVSQGCLGEGRDGDGQEQANEANGMKAMGHGWNSSWCLQRLARRFSQGVAAVDEKGFALNGASIQHMGNGGLVNPILAYFWGTRMRRRFKKCCGSSAFSFGS
jgi:hypothetical protein